MDVNRSCDGNYKTVTKDPRWYAQSDGASLPDSFWFYITVEIPFGTVASSRIFRQEIEDLWRERLDKARNQYELAVYQRRHCEESAPSPDIPLRSAQAIESAALEEYKRVLKILVDLSVDGTTPESED
jgi:hypothetical protein